MTEERSYTPLAPEAIFALIFLALSGMEFLAAPYGTVHYLGPGSYWAILIAFLLSLPLLLLAWFWRRRFPGEGLIRLGRKTLGRTLGTAGGLLFLALFLAWLVVSLRDAGELVLSYLLDRSPLWAVSAFFLLALLYVAGNGLTTLVRLAEFVLLPALLMRLAMSLVAFQGIEASHLLPVFSASPLAYLRGGFSVLGTFLPLASLFLLGDRLPPPGRFLRSGFLATAAASAVLFLSALGTIGVFGAGLTGEFLWPSLVAIHRVSFPYLLVEQLSLIFLIVWLVTFLVAASFYLHLVAKGLAEAFPRLPYRPTAAALAAAAGIGGLFLPDVAAVEAVFAALRRWIMLPAAGYPLLVCLAALIRRRGECHHAG